jgi:maltose alpha-D-glucosyltransferase / alpha-amylase
MIDDLWHKNSIFYCLSVGSYMDANGDRIGDFKGLLRRLDYLHGLGITTIWLMPFQPSPGKDDGYDISDYYGVDPRYGTLGDFVEFAHGCKQRGIRVIIDLVVTRPTNMRGSNRRGVRRTPPIATGTSGPTSVRPMLGKAWFFPECRNQPGPTIRRLAPGISTASMISSQTSTRRTRWCRRKSSSMGFWIQLGVSGFRMDAVPFVIATKGANVKKPVEQYDMLRAFREFLQWREGDAIILAEANVLPETDMEYFGRDGGRMHMMFNFHVNQHLFYALASADVRPLAKALAATRPRPATAQWGLFLRNHDELDLGRLTKPQRDAVFMAFGPEKDMQLYDRGIRRRLAPMLGGDRRRLELAYSLMFTLPGTPVIRYGDEIAMGDDLALPERNCARTPMQWWNEPHAGFTEADKPCMPVIDTGPYGFEHVNAARQRRDADSMLNWTERIIRMRKEVAEVGWGNFKVIAARDPAILIVRYDWRNNSVLFVHNLNEHPREIAFAVGLGGDAGKLLVNLLSENHSHADERGRHTLVIEGYGYRWYRVGGLDYLLKRSDIDTDTAGKASHPA